MIDPRRTRAETRTRGGERSAQSSQFTLPPCTISPWLLSDPPVVSLSCSRVEHLFLIMPPHAYRQQHSPRSTANSHTSTTQGSTSCLPFVPRQQARPLYRPASLRRSSPSPHPPRSPSVTHQQAPNISAAAHAASPPSSPSLAIVEQKQSWLGGLLSPLTDHKEFRFDVVQTSGQAAGSMCPLQAWRVSPKPFDSLTRSHFQLTDQMDLT